MRAPLLLPAALLLLACTPQPVTWSVSPGQQARFEQSRHACEILTDGPEGFERCMRRRGWRRQGWLGRLW